MEIYRVGFPVWGARAPRVLVSACRRNNLLKVRESETLSPARETRALPGKTIGLLPFRCWRSRRHWRNCTFFNREGPVRLHFFSARFCLDDDTAFIAQLFRNLIGNGVGFRIKGRRDNA